jgi:adenine/guanine/hypoxanthine permease
LLITCLAAAILSDTGGSCDPAVECLPENFALAQAACRFDDPGFKACQMEFRNHLIASTCIAAMIATFLMAIFARMPLAVAPAMGVNAYFT